jgi:tol-pal system protein YbgF
MFRNVILIGAMLPLALAAQKREIQDLQRDIANLTDQVRTLQSTTDQNNGQLKALLDQVLAASKEATSSMTVMETRVKEQFTAPMATMSTRLDQMAADFQALRESVTDVNDRLGKLHQKLEDVNNAIKVLQAPPAPPAAMPGDPSAAPSGPPAGMSAQQLYDDAMKDRSGGQLDLALQGFQQYLQYYASTELAPNAQFYVGQIHYDRGEFPQSLEAFDAVLERFSENNKTPDAMYMKGMSLLRMNQRNEAAKEFLNVIEKYPRSEVADKAKAQRKNLGLSSPSSTPAKSKKRK